MRLIKFFFLLLCLTPLAATSYNDGNQNLVDRLNRLETDLTILQKNYYRNRPYSEPIQIPQKEIESNKSYEMRITSLEEQIRKLSGDIEQNNYNINKLEEKISSLYKDVEFRFQELKEPIKPIEANDKKAANELQDADKLGVADFSDQAKDLKSTKTIIEKKNDPHPEIVKAYENLRKAEYKIAEADMNKLIENTAKDGDKGEAYFILGEVNLARKDYNRAAINYLKGYKADPKGNKSADNIYKLASTLAKLNKNSEACKTVVKITSKALEADKDIFNSAKLLSTELKCGN